MVIGFHGCDKSVRDAVINGENLKPSQNDYDWLGNGIYFWEADPYRAYEWAVEASKRKDSSVREPAVLGAVLDLGHCLDLMKRSSIDFLKLGYEWLQQQCEIDGLPLPQNRNLKNNNDFLFRNLDCAVIQKLHKTILENADICFEPFDSVRGLFIEGNEVYTGSTFKEKNHIQICVVNPNCIKGFFLPRELDVNYPIP